MKIGLMNNPHAKDTYKEIEWIGKKGFDFLDLTIEQKDGDIRPLNTRRVKKILDKYSLDLTGHTSPYLAFCSPEKEIRDAVLDELEKALDIMDDLGSPNLNFHGTVPDDLSVNKTVDRFSDIISRLIPKAKKKGIRIMMENWLNTPRYVDFYRKMFNKFDNLYLHLDVGHAYLKPDQDMVSWFLNNYADRLEHVHFSDNHKKRDNHLALGKGKIPWVKTIKTLKDYGYDNTITLETFYMSRIKLSRKDPKLYSRKKLIDWWNRC